MKKSKQPYWKHDYGEVICSECDSVFDDMLYYNTKSENTIRYKCPSCGADMREPLKRCYAFEYGTTMAYGACTECEYINGLRYCIRYTRDRMEELKSWGCFYKCEYIKPPEDKSIQLSFFEEWSE